ncbi:MAG: arginine repressor [Pseudobdellovibrio sp.]
METVSDLRNDSQARQAALRELIREGNAYNQEELCQALRQKKFDVTQSTVSRDLRRIGAIKTINKDGETIYKLPDDHQVTLPLTVSHSLGGLLLGIQGNESLIVLHTAPGSASLVARHLDSMRNELGILGTIAGDDAIFIAPLTAKKIPALIKRIKEEF